MSSDKPTVSGVKRRFSRFEDDPTTSSTDPSQIPAPTSSSLSATEIAVAAAKAKALAAQVRKTSFHSLFRALDLFF